MKREKINLDNGTVCDIELMASYAGISTDALTTSVLAAHLARTLAAGPCTMQIRLSDELWRRLTDQAALAGRSVEMEAAAILDGGLLA